MAHDHWKCFIEGHPAGKGQSSPKLLIPLLQGLKMDGCRVLTSREVKDWETIV